MDHDLALALGLSAALHVAVLSPLQMSLAVQRGAPGQPPGIEVEVVDETGGTNASAVDAEASTDGATEVGADGAMQVVPPDRSIAVRAVAEPETRAARKAPAPVASKRTATARPSVSARPGGSPSASGSSSGGIAGDGIAPIAAEPPTIAPPRPWTRNARPTYPLLARKGGIEGTVVLRFAVPPEPSANVEAIQLIQTSGYDMLDQAAEDAVRTWRFDPARQDGRPIPYTLVQQFRFALTPGNTRATGTGSDATASGAP